MTLGRGGQEKRLRVMRKAIVEGIRGWEYGGQAAKVAVGACVPGYARSGRKVYRVEVRGSVVSKVG